MSTSMCAPNQLTTIAENQNGKKYSESCLSSKWFYVKTSPVYEE